jgi:hypothetical protein
MRQSAKSKRYATTCFILFRCYQSDGEQNKHEPPRNYQACVRHDQNTSYWLHQCDYWNKQSVKQLMEESANNIPDRFNSPFSANGIQAAKEAR